MSETDSAIEQAFTRISEALDEVGPQQHVAYLAKLSLLLCDALDDPEQVRSLVESAKRDLGDEPLAED